MKKVMGVLILVLLLSVGTVFASEELSNEYGVRKDITFSNSLYDEIQVLETKTDISLNKEWIISFDENINIEKDFISISIKKNNKYIPVSIEVIDDKSIKIMPINNYEKKATYSLYIVLNNKNIYKMDFVTKDFIDEDQDKNDLDENNNVIEIGYGDKLDSHKPIIDLDKINIKGENIFSISLIENKNPKNKNYEISNNKLIYEASRIKEAILNPYSEYSLKISTNDGKNKIINLSSVISKPDSTFYGKKILMPANPDKGFNWPYYLMFPKNKPTTSKSYLIMDTANSGLGNSFEACKNTVYSRLYSNYSNEFNFPYILPVFPRPEVRYYDSESGDNSLYTHAFDRDLALWKENTKNKSQVIRNMQEANYDIDSFDNFDEQVTFMIEDAYEYLQGTPFEVDEAKVIFTGYSASGTFSDRFTMLQPDYIKMVLSGATLDDMMLPIETYKGKNLIFPIGTYDYKKITGREFDLEKINQIPKLLYMGADDTNNTVPFNDCYGDIERNIIIDLWGESVRPRAEELRELYGQSGGKGVFILDKGIKHSQSQEMREYAKNFIEVNLDSSSPVYPRPQDSEQLDYKIYE